jgi:hypothetical protein
MNHANQRIGELNGAAKIRTEDVIEIRAAVKNRDEFLRKYRLLMDEAKRAREAAALLSNSRIAKRLGVSRWAVRHVIYDATWSHVR